MYFIDGCSICGRIPYTKDMVAPVKKLCTILEVVPPLLSNSLQYAQIRKFVFTNSRPLHFHDKHGYPLAMSQHRILVLWRLDEDKLLQIDQLRTKKAQTQ